MSDNATEVDAARVSRGFFSIDRGAFRCATVNDAVAHLVIARGTGPDTDNEFRHALKRTAESLARIGVPLAIIDTQIRLRSLMTRRQMWSCHPGGAA
jgi:hypothetical protein